MHNKIIKLAFTSLFLVFILSLPVNAQSTIWNTPSTDVLAAGRTYVEADFLSHLSSYRNGGFQTYGGRVVRGVGKKLEVGFNAFYTKNGIEPQPVEFQPNAKWGFYENEKNGVKAAVGGMLFLPVTRRRGTDTFGMIYTTVSKKFEGKFGPRLTGGGYALAGRQKGLGDRAGFLAAFEQPLHPKVSFVGDWYSGKNRFGYVGGGFTFTTSKKSLLYVGYNVGNSGHRNNYLSVFYGYTF